MTPLSVIVENIPQELAERRQWVLWLYEERNGQRTKRPYQANGRPASHTDPSTWGEFARVVDTYLNNHVGRWKGIGFVLSADDPFAGIDLDHCIQPDTGLLEDWAADIVSRINSYTERSPSGTGLRILLRGKLPEGLSPKGGGRKKTRVGPDGKGAIEVYDKLRFLTITGHSLGEWK